MRYFKFAKLVRDKIPDLMKINKQKIVGMRKLDDDDFIRELIKKLIEESMELKNAVGHKEMSEELADVIEIVNYLKSELKLTSIEFKKVQKAKSDKNGKFNKKIYIEAVGIEKDNIWLDYYLKNPEKYPEVSKLKIKD